MRSKMSFFIISINATFYCIIIKICLYLVHFLLITFPRGDAAREAERKREESRLMPVSHYRGSPEDPLRILLEFEHRLGGSSGDPQEII